MNQIRFCPQCGTQLRWVNEYNQYWCDRCKQYRLMELSLKQLPEELIDGFESDYIKRGRFKPYGIYVTTDRIIGIKDGGLKRRLGISLLSMIFFLSVISVGNLIGLGNIFVLSLLIVGSIGIRFILKRFFSKKMFKSKKTVKELERRKDFEVYKNELQEIMLRKSRRLFAGPREDFIIRSAKNDYVINVYKDAPVDRLKDMFIKFGVRRFVLEEGNTS